MPESSASTLSTISETDEEDTSDSTTSPIPSTDMSEGWYNYEDIEEVIRKIHQKPETLYLPPKQDSWPECPNYFDN